MPIFAAAESMAVWRDFCRVNAKFNLFQITPCLEVQMKV